jgi:hypothetical protein
MDAMKKIYVTLLFTLMAYVGYSQPDQGNPETAPTPFGFVEVLVAAGAAFGGKKVYDAKKKTGK